jgi:hypothetical protein
MPLSVEGDRTVAATDEAIVLSLRARYGSRLEETEVDHYGLHGWESVDYQYRIPMLTPEEVQETQDLLRPFFLPASRADLAKALLKLRMATAGRAEESADAADMWMEICAEHLCGFPGDIVLDQLHHAAVAFKWRPSLYELTELLKAASQRRLAIARALHIGSAQ